MIALLLALFSTPAHADMGPPWVSNEFVLPIIWGWSLPPSVLVGIALIGWPRGPR